MKLINEWQEKLGLNDWFIITEAINHDQVIYPNDLDLKEFIGITIDTDSKFGVINHTRALTPFDVIHELLHIKYPSWTEDQINNQTNIHLTNG